MDRVQNCVAPLNPFTWDIADVEKSTSSANAVLHDIALLDLRFDFIIDEFAVPCNHTLHRMNGGYPLRRKNLSLRQLQLLQYGIVVHDGTRLVMVAVPPCVGDSGACLAASYEQLFHRSLDLASAVAHHPLLPEYTFIVYRLPETVDGDEQARSQQRPEALFRLVYRNVNPYSNPATSADPAGADFDVAAAPEYKLVAVLVSSATYYGELQRVRQYRREWYAHSAATRASGVEAAAVDDNNATEESAHNLSVSHSLPERVAAEVRKSSSLSKLCTCFARVLERFTAVEEEREPENDDVGLDDDGECNHHHCNETYPNTGETVTKGESVSTTYNLHCREVCKRCRSDPWSYQYTRDGARLVSRLTVAERTKAMLRSWRDGELDLVETVVSRTQESPSSTATNAAAIIIGEHNTQPRLSMQPQRVPCARLLLLPSHQDIPTQVSGNEIVAHLPNEAPALSDAAGNKTAFSAVVYASTAAERLRRWILQGLIAAEVHGIHVVLLDLDPVSLLLPCVELLADGDDDNGKDETPVPTQFSEEGKEDHNAAATTAATQVRYKRALLLVCQVAMETVERFVRYSGLVWKVTVAVREATAGSSPGDIITPGSDGVSFTAWCNGILELLREAETQREMAALHNTLSFAEEDGEAAAVGAGNSGTAALTVALNERALVRSDKGQLADIANLSASQQLALCTQEVVARALTLYTHKAAGPAASLPSHIITKAKAVGVQVSDADLYSLFTVFCTAAKRRDQQLPVSALVDVLTEEWSADAGKRRRYSSSSKRLVCPLDSCGVPITRARVQRFLQPFLGVMRESPSNHNTAVTGGAQNAPPPTLNYAQFSTVMFAIAKM